MINSTNAFNEHFYNKINNTNNNFQKEKTNINILNGNSHSNGCCCLSLFNADVSSIVFSSFSIGNILEHFHERSYLFPIRTFQAI